jgi:peptidylprolyl isomerase
MQHEQAHKGDTVRVNYIGKLNDETVFDSTDGNGPIEFTIGSRMLISGFEEAVEGMEIGERKEVTIPSEQAFGPHVDDMVATLDRSEFPPDFDPHVGEQFQLWAPDGRITFVKVLQLDESQVTIDANHPLAGKDLRFDIELVEIEQQGGGLF